MKKLWTETIHSNNLVIPIIREELLLMKPRDKTKNGKPQKRDIVSWKQLVSNS